MSLGPMEIMAILVVALIVFGPKRLPEVGRQVGSAVRELRRMQETVRAELRDVMAEPTAAGPEAEPPEPADHGSVPPEMLPATGAVANESREDDFTPPRTFS
ncbi:MAG: twin-arginine translocase TatA/TatE family subunit [Actinomycetota bacterium]